MNNVGLINGLTWRPQDGGAGIINFGVLTVKNSLFTGNLSHRQGGGIRVNYTGSAEIINSTFYNNQASKGGAVYSVGSLVKITNSTIANNHTVHPHSIRALMTSPDYSFRAKIELYNNIIVGNSGTVAGCWIRFPDSLTTDSPYNVNNYSDTDRCYAALGPDNGPINLGALTGSPGYLPLLGGSAALGAGASAYCPATDQLGNTRPNPSGSNCDLGAVEAGANPPTLTPTATNTTATPTMMMMGGQDNPADANRDADGHGQRHCHARSGRDSDQSDGDGGCQRRDAGLGRAVGCTGRLYWSSGGCRARKIMRNCDRSSRRRLMILPRMLIPR